MEKQSYFSKSRIVKICIAVFILGVTTSASYYLLTPPTVFMTKEENQQLENILYLDLKDGRVVIELKPEYAPNHVERIKALARQGFYNGLNFHRVIEGFMVQGGDPIGDGTGGSGEKLKQEFNSLTHKRGAVSMARAMNPDSADSQFFIVTKDSTFLDGQYTVWGYVVTGMEFVDKIKKGNLANNGSVSDPDKIVKMSVAADEEKNIATTNN